MNGDVLAWIFGGASVMILIAAARVRRQKREAYRRALIETFSAEEEDSPKSVSSTEAFSKEAFSKEDFSKEEVFSKEASRNEASQKEASQKEASGKDAENVSREAEDAGTRQA